MGTNTVIFADGRSQAWYHPREEVLIKQNEDERIAGAIERIQSLQDPVPSCASIYVDSIDVHKVEHTSRKPANEEHCKINFLMVFQDSENVGHYPYFVKVQSIFKMFQVFFKQTK